MRYRFLVTQTKGGQPPQGLIDGLEEARKQAVSDGGMISSGGLAPPEQGARATLKGGRLTVKDGPFAEAKELVGGYAIMEHRTTSSSTCWGIPTPGPSISPGGGAPGSAAGRFSSGPRPFSSA